MRQRPKATPLNPIQICFCCAGDPLALPWDKIPYEERLTFTFVPRYVNHSDRRFNVRYCPKCEAQRCENMPGRNHYHYYRFVFLKNNSHSELQFLQVGRVINTVGGYRESFQSQTDGPLTVPANAVA